MKVPLFIAVAFAPSLVLAHDARPVYIEITEGAANVYQVEWKAPATLPRDALPTVAMPQGCAAIAPEQVIPIPEGHIGRARYQCVQGIADKVIRIEYPIMNPSLTALIRVNLASGDVHHHVLPPDEYSWRVPREMTMWAAIADYMQLGAEHIWGGLDHLLFVACLILLAGTPHRVFFAITGFTAAHSLTLVLSATGLVRLAVEPVEALIALSIVFVAAEIARGEQESWTWRYPVLCSTAFGLLHGFGFASALRETGLPSSERLTALLFFNVGVEIGQLLFVCALLAGLWVLSDRRRWWPQRAITKWATPAAYCVGIVASLWFFERL